MGKETWTEEMISQLRYMWEVECLRSGLIAERLGVTKGAVVGKANRMDFKSRPSPIVTSAPDSSIVEPSQPAWRLERELPGREAEKVRLVKPGSFPVRGFTMMGKKTR